MLNLDQINALLLAKANLLKPTPQMIRLPPIDGAGKTMPLWNADHMSIGALKRRGLIGADNRITDSGQDALRGFLREI